MNRPILALILLAVMCIAVSANPAEAATSKVTCGQTIYSNTQLTSNLHCSGNGLIIGSNGITLNCAGYSISGPTTSYYTGVNVTSKSRVTVENCKTNGFWVGFAAESGGDLNTFKKNTAEGSSAEGFYIYGNNNDTLLRNKAKASQGEGFHVVGSYNSLIGNIAIKNYGNGYSTWGSYNIVSDNLAEYNSYPDEGFCGILIAGGSQNLVSGNTADYNYCGIYVTSSSASASHSNTVVNNTANWNTAVGWEFGSTSQDKVSGNTANYNEGEGFLFMQSIAGIDSSWNRFSNNTAVGDGNNGFHLIMGSSYNVFIHCTASGNTYSGFSLDDTTFNNTIRSSTADSNDNYGLFDASSGSGTAGTANFYAHDLCSGNSEGGSSPPGLCAG